jgi:hypothetical protein
MNGRARNEKGVYRRHGVRYNYAKPRVKSMTVKIISRRAR